MHYKDCPADPLPEYAFIGRSNVGKSSLINMLTDHRKLAKTSSTPGKTQLINHFIINQSWYLADLPGVGFARISKKIKQGWEKMIKDYLKNRPNLICTFLLVDSRHDIMKQDLEMMNWFGENALPFVIVFTKADKSGVVSLQSQIAKYKKSLSQFWDPLPQMFTTSSEDKTGREDILEFIESCNRAYRP